MKDIPKRSSSLFFEDDYLTPQKSFLKKSLSIALGIHIGLLITICTQSFLSLDQEKKQPKPILVHAVKLTPHPERVSMKVPEKKKTQPIQQPKEETLPSPKEENPPPPKEEPQPQKVEPKTAPVEPAPIEEKVEPVPEKKESAPQPSPKKEIKKVEKKATPPPKPQKKAKQSPSATSSPKTATTTPKKKENTVSKEVAKNVQALLAQAKMQRKGFSDKKGSSQKNPSSSSVGQVNDLSFEKDSFEDSAVGDYEATPEEAYIANLIRLIQISVTLPDKEPVSLKLELFSSGLIKSLTIVSSQSPRNRKAVEKGLSSLRFPAFIQAYKKEKSHTFSFKFTREMEWVSL